jgi:hypothetical protein
MITYTPIHADGTEGPAFTTRTRAALFIIAQPVPKSWRVELRRDPVRSLGTVTLTEADQETLGRVETPQRA